MTVETGRVEAFSSSGPVSWPTALHWEGQRLPVSRLVAEWRTPQGKHFLVQTAGGRQFECHFIEDQSSWRVSER